MSSVNRKKTIISVLIFIIPLFLVVGIGIYKYWHTEKVKEENALPTIEKEIVDPKPSKSKNEIEKPGIEEIPILNPAFEPEETEMNEPEAEKVEELKKELEISHIEKKELGMVYIPQTKSLFVSSNISIESFQSRLNQKNGRVYGKLYYQGENGRLESYLSVDSNGLLHEYLVSYDPAGNSVETIEIGLLPLEKSHEKKYATFSVDRLSIFELSASKVSGKKEERVTEYSITPQLRFHKGKTFTKILY
jgi:flagellar basal body-associated protein FliL